MSYHPYPCKSTTAPTRKWGFFLLHLTPLGRNSLRPYICSSLSVYFGMAHGKVGAASCSKRYKYLRAVYMEVGHVYALFTFYRLHFHQKLVARFTHPEMVTNLGLRSFAIAQDDMLWFTHSETVTNLGLRSFAIAQDDMLWFIYLETVTNLGLG